MKTELMPTQVEDVAKQAAGTDIPNFSEPGTGKTLTTIAAIEAAKLQSGLIVCPTVATLMWKRLLEEELGAKAQHLLTKSTEIDKTADFLVASYGVIAAHQPALMERDNAAFVIDESHYIKSSIAQRTKVLMGDDCDGEGGIYETSQQCWELTGTPMERYADDLWSQLRATQPELLAKYRALDLKDFQLQFCRMATKTYANGRVTKRVSVGNQQEALLSYLLFKEIGAIRRTMDDVDPFMPEATERAIFVQHAKIPELLQILGIKTKEQLAELIKKNDASMSTARRLMGIAKLKSSIDYIQEQRKQHPILVGYWHDEVGKAIVDGLYHKDAVVISGATPPGHRERIRRRFIDGDITCIVGQIQAMGIAMDGLQEVCSHVIIAENDWSAAKVEQFYKRAARKGQRNHVQVDFLKCNLDLEDVIDDIRKDKRTGAKLVLS